MKLSQEEIDKKLKNLGGWQLKINLISKDFEFENFQEALGFVNKVGEIAESKNHHPNILMHDYKNVRIETSTHDEDGITQKDFNLAKEIEKIND